MSKLKDECVKCEKLDFHNADCLDRRCENFPCDGPKYTGDDKSFRECVLAMVDRQNESLRELLKKIKSRTKDV